MYNKLISNNICNYLCEYQVQKKHIERVLSAKEIIQTKIPPYTPKFLKLKLCKNQMEEEKNNKIKEENKQLFYKIIDAEVKPSKYSRIYKPKECPSFNKFLIYFKRVKKEIEDYEENMRFYNKLEKVKSFYDNKELNERNKIIDSNIKKLHKSIIDLQPSLLFLSPQGVKRQIQNFKNINHSNTSNTKRCNSCMNRKPSKSTYDQKKNENSNNKQSDKTKTEKENITGTTQDNNSKVKNSKSPSNKSGENQEKNKNKEKNEKILNEEKSEQKSENLKKIKLSLNGQKSKGNKREKFNQIEKPKPKVIKYGLKRNTSEINIFK